MNRLIGGCCCLLLSLLVTRDREGCSAFQLSSPSSITTRTTVVMRGKMWKRLEIEEDDITDGTSWYLINCVAGLELDLLNQARQVCADFPSSDVEKFVVPTERHLRSHGDKRKVVDVKVRYPGYVFCKIRLVENVYETLQSLELARSWMGTINRKGHKKLPPIPTPLGSEEIAKFKGLEEEQEVFEDMFGGDYTGRTDSGADLMSQYAGYDVGQMVKVLRGNFEGEDGTVRRLKDGQLMIRMFTYGQTYDEWFDVDAIRPLTDLEALRGLSGPTTPIDQDQFDVSIGKKDPESVIEGRFSSSSNDMPISSLRSGLMQSVAGAASSSGRNRREDRVARGETNRDAFGRSVEEIRKEEQNWLAYREEKRVSGGSSISTSSSGGSDSANAETRMKERLIKKSKDGPKKGQDTWGIKERSSWNGGEYEEYGTSAVEEEKERKRRLVEAYRDIAPPASSGRDGRDGRNNGRDTSFVDNKNRDNQRRGADDRRESRDADRQERRPAPAMSARQPRDRVDDWSSSTSSNDEENSFSPGNRGGGGGGDFFDSLMSDLNNDLRTSSERIRGERRTDYAGPNTSSNTRVMDKNRRSAGAEEDSFFTNLMSELGGVLDEPTVSTPRGTAKSQQNLDNDDFFSSLEAELSQSLGGTAFGSGTMKDMKNTEEYSDDDDFFANLEQEMGNTLPRGRVDENTDDTFQDNFFSTLLGDVRDELESPRNEHNELERNKGSSPPTTQSSPERSGDLSALTVPELKDLLRSKGLKVGGNKVELISRLQSQS